MTDKQKLQEIFELQNKLNIRTCGANWRDGISKNGKPINWLTYIDMEFSELVGSINFKHWKDNNDNDIDIENIKMECVDILHFLVSHIIDVSTTRLEFDLDRITQAFTIAYNSKHTGVVVTTEDSVNYSAVLMRETNNIKSLIYKLDDIYYLPGRESHTELCALCIEKFLIYTYRITGLTFDDVYRLYVGKNVLNIFRQDNGYLEGTYKKVWDGKEDNVYVTQVLEENKEMSFDSLYNYIDKKYKELNNVK